MFEGLTQIEWDKLEHAYGPASDMPDVIRTLTWPDASVRRGALEHLNTTLWQRGSITQAAAYAIPFLIEALSKPATEDKREIIMLLARLGKGRSLLVPPDNRIQRDLLTDPDVQAQQQRERRWASTAAEAVARGIRTYLRLLDDDDLEVRLTIPYLLSTLPTQAQQSVPALGTHLGESNDPRVRASVLFALGSLATPNAHALGQLSNLLDEPTDLLVKIAAAGALVLLERENTPHAAATALIEAIAQPDSVVVALYNQLPWCKSGFTGDLAATIAWLGPEAGSLAVPVLCRVLDASELDGEERASDTPPTSDPAAGEPAVGTAHICTRTLLHLAFGGRVPATPLIRSRLNENQRNTLIAIAQSDAVWHVPSIASELLGALALPNTRAALRQSLQLPV